MADHSDFDRPNPHRTVIQMVPYPDELRRHGRMITCTGCRASRDWLLLNVRSEVFVRCRCANEWLEPDLSRAEFDDSFTRVERAWDSFEEAVTALAFDGLLAGAIWD